MLKKFNFEKTPVVELVNEILVDATKRGASDIHFDPQENYLKARIRIDGELIDYAEIPINIAKNLITRVKIISGMNITESRLPQDGAIKATLEDIDLDLRVSAIPTNKGEKIVIRILDYSLSLAGLESLGFNTENYKKVLKMIASPNGIILVTGATGSGKSTTVYSILQTLNKEETNIVTVEDPIEMSIEGLNQVQVNSEIGMTFSKVLRSILRQDPNIILIGEIRDSETAKIAVRSSITGHLVLSTVHTNNALSTVERLLDMGVERYLLSTALTGIISQRLAKRICPKCCVERDTTDYEKRLLKRFLNKDVPKVFDASEGGCSECHNGYSGRIAIQEVLEFDDDIRNALNSDDLKKEDLRNLVYTDKVITMLQDALGKVIDGIISFDEVYRIIEIDDVDSVFNGDDSNNIDIDNKDNHNTLNIPTFTKEEKAEEVKVVPAQPIANNNPVTTPVVAQSVQSINPVGEKVPAVQPIQVNPVNSTPPTNQIASLGTEVEDDKKQETTPIANAENITIPIVEQENTQ